MATILLVSGTARAQNCADSDEPFGSLLDAAEYSTSVQALPPAAFFTPPTQPPLPSQAFLTNLPAVSQQGTAMMPGSPGTCEAQSFGYGLGSYTAAHCRQKATPRLDEIQTSACRMALSSWNWTAIATCVIAISTIASVVVSCGQWSAINGQLAEMQAEQRPWLYAKGGPIPAGVTPHQEGSVGISMQFNLVNVGHTPATNVLASFTPYLRGFANSRNVRESVCHDAESKVQGITIFPGDEPLPWGFGCALKWLNF